jgi:site-specific DNA-methyltransferase (adenine-specific)
MLQKEIYYTQFKNQYYFFEYLVKTYSNIGDIILDNTAGSGTTAIVVINTNRNFILIEKDKKYYEIAKQRIISHIDNILN